MTTATSEGVRRIATERARQIDVEGYATDHDAMHHREGSLARAAIAYAYAAGIPTATGMTVAEWFGGQPPAVVHWPWAPSAWKPSEDPVRNLEKAGALIAAEIDRLLAGAEVPA